MLYALSWANQQYIKIKLRSHPRFGLLKVERAVFLCVCQIRLHTLPRRYPASRLGKERLDLFHSAKLIARQANFLLWIQCGVLALLQARVDPLQPKATACLATTASCQGLRASPVKLSSVLSNRSCRTSDKNSRRAGHVSVAMWKSRQYFRADQISSGRCNRHASVVILWKR